jgi:hypothetical protein
MTFCVVVASGASGVQAVTGDCELVGYSVRESSGGAGAPASVVLRDGTSSAGASRAFATLAALGTDSKLVPAVEFKTGIFVDRTAGSTELVLYLD